MRAKVCIYRQQLKGEQRAGALNDKEVVATEKQEETASFHCSEPLLVHLLLDFVPDMNVVYCAHKQQQTNKMCSV